MLEGANYNLENKNIKIHKL